MHHGWAQALLKLTLDVSTGLFASGMVSVYTVQHPVPWKAQDVNLQSRIARLEGEWALS